MSKKLYNSLVDFLVVAGFDEDTGLSPQNDFEEAKSYSASDDIFTMNYDAHVLATITNDTAFYPNRSFKFNLFYPQIEHQHKPIEGVDSLDINTAQIEPSNPRKLTRRATIKPSEKSITPEVLDNIPEFCFLDRTATSLSKKTKEPKIHSFVLTDVEGNKTFAIVMNLYREFYCCTQSNENNKYDLIRIDDDEDQTEENKNYLLVYVPTSVLLLSKYFYFNVLKDCLSTIYDDFSRNPNDFNFIIERYAYQLTNMPVPPNCAERFGLTLEYDLFGKAIILQPGDEYTDNVFDLNISIIFFKYSINDIIKILLILLTEQKCVFISKDYCLLTPIIECFMRIMYPFKWQPTYVPILPTAKIDFVEAPNPFIMGCNSSYKQQILKNQDVCVVDIDEGTVIIPQSLNLINFPRASIEFLKSGYKKIDINLTEITKLSSVIQNDLEEYLKSERTLNQTLNTQLINLFLQFYVQLFGDIYSYIKIQSKQFNKKKFIDDQLDSDKQFYEQILNTLIFDSFIDDRISNYSLKIHDPYFTLFDQTKSNQLLFSSSSTTSMTIANSDSANNLSIIQKTNGNGGSNGKSLNFVKSTKKYLKMPKFEINYRLKCIEFISKELETANALTYKDCLRYLNGLLQISVNNVLDGFKSLYQIECQSIFPKNLIQNTILTALNAQIKETLLEAKFYINSNEWKKIPKVTFNRYMSVSIDALDEDDFVDVHDLNFTEFCDALEQKDIRVDYEMADRLFKALTLEKSTLLDFTTFELFIEYWVVRDQELQTINKYLPKAPSNIKEFALKVSNQSVNTRHGIGRIVLTQKFLYHLAQGTNQISILVELKNIKNIEKYTNYEALFGTGKPALKITDPKNEIIILNLMDERNLWYILIKELISAIILSEKLKDISIIHYGAKHVRLISALVGCANNDHRASNASDLEQSANYLSHYTTMLNNDDITDEINQILHMRINPSNRELDKNSVECMIYVNHQNMMSLWCAVGSRIKIFDPMSWTYESSDIKLKERITCMVYVPFTSKIWIATIDKCIYVLDIETTSFEKKLKAHTDVIVSIMVSYNEKEVISAASNGEIFFWDIEKLENFQNIKLSDVTSEFSKILINVTKASNRIFCLTSDKVLIFTDQFVFDTCLIMLSKENDKEKLLSLSCLCVSNEPNQNFIWVGCSSDRFIWVWDLDDNYELRMRIGVDEIVGFRSLLYGDGTIWAGSKDGKLVIFSTNTFEHDKSLDAHTDSIRCLCLVNGKFVVSGSGSKDGTIAVWQVNNSLSNKSILSTIEKILDKRKSSPNVLKIKIKN